MDQLLAMRVFARVVEAGTFTRAADSLRMPKATVTKLVQGLEAHLRVRLLRRTTRRVAVTQDGAVYYERVTGLLGELEEIEASLRSARDSPRGRLRVDVGGSVASAVVIPALPAFQARYPEIVVDLGVTDRTVDLIRDNVDCVIRTSADEPSMVARRVGSLAWITCAAPGYLARHGVPRHPSDVEAGHVVAGYASARTGRLAPMRFAKGGESFVVEGRSRVTVNESNAHLAAGLAGLGLLHTFEFMARPHVATGALVPVLEDWRREPQPVYAVYPQPLQAGAKLRAFVEWVAEVFARVR